MIKPNFVGLMERFDDPTEIDLLAADIAAIDSDRTTHTYYPYAYTATIAENQDEVNFTIVGRTLPSNMKLAIGLFLTADNTKGNLLFSVQGSVVGNLGEANVVAYPIFGRTDATTVTSTKVAQANELETYKILNSTASGYGTSKSMSFNTNVLGMEDTTRNAWCLALVLENHAGADKTLLLNGSLAIQKYSTTVPVFKPERH